MLSSDTDDAEKKWYRKRVCGNRFSVLQVLLVMAVATIVGILILLLAIIPAIVQGIVNKAQINFTSIYMQNITDSTFTITANGAISHTGSIGAKIAQSAPLSVYYKGSKIGTLNIPNISVKGGAASTALVIDNSLVTVTDTALFTQYGADLVNSAQANWQLKGHVNVHAIGMSFHDINFDKELIIPGMMGLKNTTVNSFNLPGDSQGQLDLVINATIYNPSFVGMKIGDIRFNIIYQNYIIGNLIAPNVTMLPGMNALAMSGVIQPTSNASLPSVSVFFSRYIAGLATNVSVQGTGGSATTAQWLAGVLQSLDISTGIAGGKNLSLIFNLELNQLSMVLPGIAGQANDSGLITIASSVQSGFKSPFPITLDIYAVSIAGSMSVGGKVIGTIAPTAYFPSTSNQTLNLLNFAINQSTLQIADRTQFTSLVNSLVLSPNATFNLSGSATAMVRTRIGNLVFTNISFQDQPIPLNGFNMFTGNLIQIQQPNNHITNGLPWGLQLYLNVAITNPSSIQIQLSSLSFDLYYQGAIIGNATIPNVSLKFGVNNLVSYANYVRPANTTLETIFMSNYLQGNDSQVNLIGNGFNIPLMAAAVLKLNISLVFPGQTQDLLAWANLDVNLLAVQVATTLSMFNPIDANISLEALDNFNIFKTDWSSFTFLSDTSFNPTFAIPSHQVATTGQIALSLTGALSALINDPIALIGNHTFLAVGHISFSVGQYGPVNVTYQQNFTLIGI